MTRTSTIVSLVTAFILAVGVAATAVILWPKGEPQRILESISIKIMPKTMFLVDEALSVTGGMLSAKYSDNTYDDVAMTVSMITAGFDSSELTPSQVLTVKYNNKTTTYSIKVVEVSALDIRSSPIKSRYFVGKEEPLSLVGGTLNVQYFDGEETDTEIVTMTADMVSGFDNEVLAAESQTITVEFGGLSGTFNINFVEVSVFRLSIVSLPDKLTYGKDEFLDVTGGSFKAFYTDGTVGDAVDLTLTHVGYAGGFQFVGEGEHGFQITYEGFTSSSNLLNVVAEFELDEIYLSESWGVFEEYEGTITIAQDTTLKNWADSAGYVLGCKYLHDGSEFNIGLDNASITGFDTSELGTFTMEISYRGVTKTYSYTVVAAVVDWVNIETYKIRQYYAVGEEIDLTGLILETRYTNGLYQIEDGAGLVAVEDFDSSIEATINVKITYLTYETTFTVYILEDVSVLLTEFLTFIQDIPTMDDYLDAIVFGGFSGTKWDNFDDAAELYRIKLSPAQLASVSGSDLDNFQAFLELYNFEIMYQANTGLADDFIQDVLSGMPEDIRKAISDGNFEVLLLNLEQLMQARSQIYDYVGSLDFGGYEAEVQAAYMLELDIMFLLPCEILQILNQLPFIATDIAPSQYGLVYELVNIIYNQEHPAISLYATLHVFNLADAKTGNGFMYIIEILATTTFADLGIYGFQAMNQGIDFIQNTLVSSPDEQGVIDDYEAFMEAYEKLNEYGKNVITNALGISLVNAIKVYNEIIAAL
ncbi:MAG: hypothetical protein FWE53_04955 [Firmicutes bacterium]|nr:hypothetical protein [Bacillota bacterium]